MNGKVDEGLRKLLLICSLPWLFFIVPPSFYPAWRLSYTSLVREVCGDNVFLSHRSTGSQRGDAVIFHWISTDFRRNFDGVLTEFWRNFMDSTCQRKIYRHMWSSGGDNAKSIPLNIIHIVLSCLIFDSLEVRPLLCPFSLTIGEVTWWVNLCPISFGCESRGDISVPLSSTSFPDQIFMISPRSLRRSLSSL